MTGKNKVAIGDVKFHSHARALPDEVERDSVEHCLTSESMYFGLRIDDLRRLAYDVAEANNIEHSFNIESQMAGKKWYYVFMRRHPKLSLREPESTSLNADVDLHNTRRLNALPAQPVTIQAFDRWPARWTERSTADAEKRSGLATSLTVKVGARVMLVRNVETEIGLFNGALGTVTGFDRRPPALPTAILVLFDNKRL